MFLLFGGAGGKEGAREGGGAGFTACRAKHPHSSTSHFFVALAALNPPCRGYRSATGACILRRVPPVHAFFEIPPAHVFVGSAGQWSSLEVQPSCSTPFWLRAGAGGRGRLSGCDPFTRMAPKPRVELFRGLDGLWCHEGALECVSCHLFMASSVKRGRTLDGGGHSACAWFRLQSFAF